jgi:hypothetical protein
VEPDIAPLAKRLAEENNVDWRHLHGTGASGRIVERDILEYLARVMAGEEDLNPTPEPLPEGMEAWPEQDVAGFFGGEAATKAAETPPVDSTLDDALLAVDDDEMIFADSDMPLAGTTSAMQAVDDVSQSYRDDALSAEEIDEDIFLFDDPEPAHVVAETPNQADARAVADDAAPHDDGRLTDTPVPVADVFIDDEFADEDEDIFAFDEEPVAVAEALESAMTDDTDTADDALDEVISFADAVAPTAADAPLWQDELEAEVPVAEATSEVASEPMAAVEADVDEADVDRADRDARLEGAEAILAAAEAAVEAELTDADEDAQTPTQLWAASPADEAEPAEASEAAAQPLVATDTDFVLSDASEAQPTEADKVHTAAFDAEEPVAVSDPEVTERVAAVTEVVAQDGDDEASAPDDMTPAADASARAEEHIADLTNASETPAAPLTVVAAAAQPQLGVAKTETHISAKVATLPLVSYGALLRRRTELTTLVQAQLAISHELGDEAPVSPAGFLLRAAAKGLKRVPLGDVARLGFAVIQDGTITIKHVPDADQLPFRELLAKLAAVNTLPDIAAAEAGLVVADLSDFDVDEAFLNVGAPVLTLGRILVDSNAGEHHSTLSLSGDIKVEQGSRYLAAVTELLNSPVRLVV